MCAMIMVALTFISCPGSDDEGDEGEGTSSFFSITCDGEKTEVDNAEWLNPLYSGFSYGNFFTMESYPVIRGQIHIVFPYDQYGEYVQPSYFNVGYSDFGEDATDIEFITSSLSGWDGEYISGSAKVIKNSGSSITVKFSKYKFGVERRELYHEFILEGTLEFKCYLYK